MQPRNPYLCLAIVVSMAVCLNVGMIGILLMGYAGKEPPTSAVALVSTAIGSLSSFLVSVPRGSAGGDGNNQKPAA